MAAQKKKRRKRQSTAPPAPIATPEEIHQQRVRIHQARRQKYPPAVTVHALRPHPLLAPEAGVGYQVDITTSYGVNRRELERAILYGFRYCPPEWTP